MHQEFCDSQDVALRLFPAGPCREKSASACECKSVSPSVQVIRQSSRCQSFAVSKFLFAICPWKRLSVVHHNPTGSSQTWQVPVRAEGAVTYPLCFMSASYPSSGSVGARCATPRRPRIRVLLEPACCPRRRLACVCREVASCWAQVQLSAVDRKLQEG